MKSRIVKNLIFILMILTLVIPNFSYAGEDGDDTDTDTDTDQLALEDLTKYKSEAADMGELEDKAETILGYISIIGIVSSVVALIMLGIKYMMGSIEERSQYKETLKLYIIGAFMVFTGSLVPEIIYKIIKSLF